MLTLHGRYETGTGGATAYTAGHDRAFGCRMVGTFNVGVDQPIDDERPTLVLSGGDRYWLVNIRHASGSRHAWAYRWPASQLPHTILELVSKRALPEEFKAGVLDIDVPEKWSADYVHDWATPLYWFQTFPWSEHVRKADSAQLWRAIDCIDWAGLEVLDYGCHTGFHCFEASKRGAQALGYDPATEIIERAQIINDHIERQDCEFTTAEPSGKFDVVLYLSVHHQRDAEYRWLAAEIARLRVMCRKHVFVELHVRLMEGDMPVRPQMSEAEIDRIVGGEVLLRYEHRLRGTRKLYRCDCNADAD